MANLMSCSFLQEQQTANSLTPQGQGSPWSLAHKELARARHSILQPSTTQQQICNFPGSFAWVRDVRHTP